MMRNEDYWGERSPGGLYGLEFQHPVSANPFLDYLEQEPRTAFFGHANQFGTNPTRRRAIEDMYPQALNQFYGALGQQIMGGGAPTLQFRDFLKGMDFTKRFAQLNRATTRGRRSGFQPRTRYLFQDF